MKKLIPTLNVNHQVGTENDKTPTGVYEGMSCLDCHNPHSNKLKNEYWNVHLTNKR